MQFHSVASIFPMMSVEEFKALKESIQARGQRNPIYTYEGKIVDGRNRYQACTELGVKPRFEEWDGNGLLVDFVWDMNAGRRQLTGGALRLAAGRYTIEREKEANQRQVSGLRHVSSSRPIGRDDEIKELGDFGSSRSKAAQKFGVGEGSVQRAVSVLKYGVPELAQAVESGQVTVNAAAEIAKRPREEQKEYIAQGFPTTKSNMDELDEKESNGEIKLQGVGVFRAHEAINSLKRIPKNDALRKRGFQIVTDWIRHNQ
jgi:ParB-like nuclease family protein